jgi:hypothetical protein
MDSRRLFCLSAFVALGLLPALEAWALGLARARGAVLVGRPLNVTIAATLDSSDPDTPCVDAEVFQGDARIDPRRVTTRWEPASAGHGTVRVLADVPVEEPLLTLYVRVGCTNKVTRRYVLLSEQPADNESAVQAASAAPDTVRLAPAAAQGVPRVAAPATESALRIRPAPRIAQAPAAADGRKRRARAPATQPPPAQARLKIEALDLLAAEPEPPLKTTARLAQMPGTDEERRRQAAALWRALSAGPEEAMRNSERLQTLERDVRGLHDLTRRNAAAVELMREQTEKARGERNAMTQLAIGLALLIAMIAFALLWRAGRGTGARLAWWGGGPPIAADSETPSVIAPAQPAATPAPAAAAGRGSPEVDLSFTHSTLEKIHATPTISGVLPNHKTEELIDTQQQADFFLSIGQPERAVRLLETHLQQPGDASALAWMELLELYHALGRRDDYERVRRAFHVRYNARVPQFDRYIRAAGGLDKHDHAVSRISTLWHSHRALEPIEDLLMRRPDAGDADDLDVEAYRDLVLLYNIAKEVSAQEGSADTGPPSNPHGAAHVQGAAAKAPARDPLDIPRPSKNLGLDIDLDEVGDSAPLIDLDGPKWRSKGR